MKIMMSVVALYNYDNTLFDVIQLPAGVEKNVLVDSIIMEAGELPVVYPDAGLFKRLLGRWSVRKKPQWTRFKAACDVEYDMLSNYDRMETETVEKEIEGEREKTNTGTVSINGTLEQDGTIEDVYSNDTTVDYTGDSTVDHTGTETNAPATTQTRNVNAYDTAALVPTETMVMSGNEIRTDNLKDKETRNLKDVTDADSTNTRTLDTLDTSHTTTENNLMEYEEHIDADTTERTLHAYGNIGTLTSQQMLQSELDIVPQLDVYKVIVSDFVDAFCIGVY